MNQEENNDPVWKLLEQARKREASSAFVRNVVRAARVLDAEARDSQGAPGIWSALFDNRSRLAWTWAAVGALVAGAFAFHTATRDPSASMAAGAPSSAAAGETSAYSRLALDLIPVSAGPAEQVPSLEAFEAELNDLDYLGELLAVQDAVLLSDEEIARMLY